MREDTECRDDLSPPQHKPYERPMIVYRQLLEANAQVCAPRLPAKSHPGGAPRGRSVADWSPLFG
jgi:hypothetical protein